MRSVAVGPRAWSDNRSPTLELAAYATLVLVYVCDAMTPPELSLEVGYEVPVAIAALTSQRASVIRVAIAAASANIFGYVTDSMQSGLDWIGFQNRLIAFASLTLVCALSIVVQTAAASRARMEEQRRALDLERELSLEIDRRGRVLDERQDAIAELVEAIAHDVRTPLEALSLTLNQALRGQYGELPDAYREVASESRHSIGDITRLADTLLAVARFESESATPQAVAVSVADIVRDLANEFTPLADARDVALTYDVPPSAIVAAGASDLRRAVANLVANAIRHTSAGGRVAIDASPNERGWNVEVVDDGVGVSEAQVRNLFERYSHGAGGTGLGLHIVKRIAESFGGSVSYESIAPHGSRFRMSLPAWAEVA